MEIEGAYAADALHARLAPAKKRPVAGGGAAPEAPVKRQDAALATELVFGVLRWQRLLDFLIERQAKRSAEGLDADVRRALRLGAYQMLFLDRVPASAAVNESVELVKLAGKERAAGLVNAVLRRMPHGPYRAGDFDRTLPIGLGKAARLGILYSHPEWMIERWLGTFGEESTRALLEANNRPLPTACWVLDGEHAEQVAESLREDGLEVEPGRLLASALILRGGSASETTAFREGWIAIQDEASQAVALLADVQKGQSVLDLCAAPGNKTLHLARAAGPGARVVAADLHVHRLRAVRGQMERTGTDGVELVALDASRAFPIAGRFDRILVDAPCSGTGTLARNPEIRWRLRREDIEDLAARQAGILRNAMDVLAPRGRLVYATCSLEREENEGVVRRVLGERKDVRLPGAPAGFAERLAPGVLVERLFDAEGFFRTMPAETATDGFFAAILERV
ncbi:MAG: 16S rRNA (cytosine(967)-C(5))-methyltransferase RsmB [Acidobacteriota bacterium]|nr:16S rRNA (cytosine(967)-C(5))-methyltransferase RsmB [Acidobacteriota bacterium]